MRRLSDLRQGQGKILKNTEHLIAMGEALSAQVEKTQAVLLTGMFEATEVSFPTSCIILPHKLEKEGEIEGIVELLEEEGDKEEEGEEEVNEAQFQNGAEKIE